MSQFPSFFDNNVGKQLLWERTIYQVIRLFEEAERRVRSDERQTYFCNLDGWWRNSAQRINKKGPYRIPEETAVSEALIEQMEKVKEDFILNANNLDSDIEGIDMLQFGPEVPRRQKRGIGRKAKPTDFRFYRSGIGGFDLRIEAKLLTKDTEITKVYLSKDGIGRFSDKSEPYTDDLVGGMIAYTVSEDRSAWLTKIRNGMSSSSPIIPSFDHNVLSNDSPILFSRIPFNFPKNPPQAEVLVFHLVLEFDSDPPAR